MNCSIWRVKVTLYKNALLQYKQWHTSVSEDEKFYSWEIFELMSSSLIWWNWRNESWIWNWITHPLNNWGLLKFFIMFGKMEENNSLILFAIIFESVIVVGWCLPAYFFHHSKTTRPILLKFYTNIIIYANIY